MRKSHRQLMAGRGQAADSDRRRLAWWRDARFGMFIHWGLYAVPAGEWEESPVPGIGEWIMYNARIPVSEYEQLAPRFNPVDFDAEEWVGLAKAAGMRYLVITAKHHDGFAMFRSPSNPYNIVDATPFGRDPLAELAAACRKAGVTLGFYYSQDQDWHHPDGAWNDWDYDEGRKDFDRYFRDKVIPQIRELLTQYGPIGLIWFDTPYTIDADHSRELRDLVHSLQPDCLVSGRVGHDLGDYGSLGDNQIPVGRISGEYETPATMNNTWGYRKDDEDWKSTETLLFLLIDLASKGINYLLNVGPTAAGRIPEPSIARLNEIGAWLSLNGDAIYGTEASPFPYELPWGRMTVKENRLYLILFEWPEQELEIVGLGNTVGGASLLSDASRTIAVEQRDDAGIPRLRLSAFGPPPAVRFPVVVLTVDGSPTVDSEPLQQGDGSVSLPAFMAQRSSEEIEITRAGFTDGWHDTRGTVHWEFKAHSAAELSVRVVSSAPRAPESRVDADRPTAKGPHHVVLEIADNDAPLGSFSGPLNADESIDSPRSKHHPEIASLMGTVTLPGPGRYTVTLRASRIAAGTETGLAISGVELRPVGRPAETRALRTGVPSNP